MPIRHVIDQVSKDFCDLVDGHRSWSTATHQAVHKFLGRYKDSTEELVSFKEYTKLKEMSSLANVCEFGCCYCLVCFVYGIVMCFDV
jgi:hypothetical protein